MLQYESLGMIMESLRFFDVPESYRALWPEYLDRKEEVTLILMRRPKAMEEDAKYVKLMHQLFLFPDYLTKACHFYFEATHQTCVVACRFSYTQGKKLFERFADMKEIIRCSDDLFESIEDDSALLNHDQYIELKEAEQAAYENLKPAFAHYLEKRAEYLLDDLCLASLANEKNQTAGYQMLGYYDAAEKNPLRENQHFTKLLEFLFCDYEGILAEPDENGAFPGF